MLLIFPSKSLDKLFAKKTGFTTLYLIFTITIVAISLHKLTVIPINNQDGLVIFLTYILVLPFMYYPIIYGSGYLIWIIAKGFKGTSSFVEMRTLMVYAYMPFILQLIISIPFILVGLLKNNNSIINHDNSLTNLILWFFSFRILTIGIAKFNKFNWMITLITYLIAISVLGGLAYLLLQLKR